MQRSGMPVKEFAKSVAPRPLWAALSRARFDLKRRVSTGTGVVQAVRELGFPAATSLLLAFHGFREQGFPGGRARELCRMRIKGYDHPLFYRAGTSDPDVIRQVFIARDYDCLANEQGVSLIIDCGANIGCTSFFLLHRYPDAHLIAVEPDPGNFAVCRRNLAPFSHRVTLVNSGIWSVAAPLRVERNRYGDGREWSYQVRPVAEGETSDFVATTIDALIEDSPYERADILKLDIEGAEREVFCGGAGRWLDRTRNLAIELHDEECEAIFHERMLQYRCKMIRTDELTVCHDITGGQ